MVKVATKDLLQIPDLMRNLIFVSNIRKAGFVVTFVSIKSSRGTCMILQKNNGYILLVGHECGSGFYDISLTSERNEKVIGAPSESKAPLKKR